jgi:hypothetical protein
MTYCPNPRINTDWIEETTCLRTMHGKKARKAQRKLSELGADSIT